jgi:type I restriction enzyme M protein
VLDTDTKRRIDTARDILVGKVPDPKSQVEQITIALIYKFMDDMDAEAEELGGNRKFFAGDYARYGWAKLMRSGLGGHETLNLYADAIAKMPENPGIPPLFRDIFKNAFLPYRDPETLRAFLRIIDEFEYDHSERLGDAFEYLLSVLGSQGEAGQFRTPRHIIDFIVAIVDPKKSETVLDPACGTAGFLISSFKHILTSNTEEAGNNALTPDERGRLAANFKGYDISPDMVRLSLVNMYLHGFTDPHIYEYDTLTSQERWNEYADVILANPPFMSPKGGIKPHNRFSVQSKRSEVLFVDYMAEHLTPAGRAGIIVPEGVIFQSQTAYIQLRKMLLEGYLVAVVSLPAGVFNPYSGVKTSILILDKALAKQTDRIAFFTIENDGFGLGAQRRPIDKNDLPQARAEITEYLRRLRSHEVVDDFQPTLGLVVPKQKIAANSDCNLNGDRYREDDRLVRAKWPIVSLGEICTFMTGGTPASTVPDYYEGGTVPWLVSGDIHKGEIRDCERRITEKGVENSNARFLPENSVLIALNGQGKTRGTVAMLRMKATCNQSLVAITPTDPNRAIPEYVFWTLRSMYEDIRALTGDNERSGLSMTILRTIRIPLPPLDVQKELVAEIGGYQKVIDGARGVLANYRARIPVDPDWPTVELGSVIEDRPRNGYSGKPVEHATDTKVLTLSATTTGKLDATKFKYLDEDIPGDADCRCRYGDIYLQRGNTADLVGTAALFDLDDPTFIFPDLMIRVRADQSKIEPRFLVAVLQEPAARSFLTTQAVGAAGSMPKINQAIVERLPVPLPPLEIQRAIVAELEIEQALVNASRDLIARMDKKTQVTLTRVWGKNGPAQAEA